MYNLQNNNIYAIPTGQYFGGNPEACYLIYAPLANLFFLSTKEEVVKLESQMRTGQHSDTLDRLLEHAYNPETQSPSTDTFCTLHILLNEKCNFSCSYCYSAKGRSKAEATENSVKRTLDFFLSAERNAPQKRTVMFMGGGEPTLSWNKLVESTLYAEEVAEEQGVKVGFQLTTNGSVLNDEMINFFKQHDFVLQISFEMLPDVQDAQRGHFDLVADNLRRLTEEGVNLYVRSTITEMNVERIAEAVQYCHRHFPLVRKYSCQQVVDGAYFDSPAKVKDFFDRYYHSFNEAKKLAESYGLDLRSSSSHLLNYTKRERFCFNLMVLTPFETITLCPDISSPKEEGYRESIIGTVGEDGVVFNQEAFAREGGNTIHKFEKCRSCFARWNCGSGCPSSRKVYSEIVFDAICDHYRRMLVDSLMDDLAGKYNKNTGGDFYHDIKQKLGL